GAPQPEASWKKDGNPISPANVDMQTTQRNSKLTIPAAEIEDTGVYELTLKNEAGTETVPVKVIVVDKPGRPKGPLDVVDIYAERCALMWDKPTNDGGSPITGYVVEKLDTATDKWVKVCETDAEDLEVDVSDLETGHKYAFRVSAVNEFGVGLPLETDGEILAKDPWDPSDAPGTPNILDYDKDYVEVGWEAPKDDGGAPIQSYNIEYREKGTDTWKKGTEVPGTEEKGTVSGLVEGKEYEFRVAAKNKAGLSPFSEVSGPVVTKNRKVKPRIDERTLPQNIKIKVGQALNMPVDFVGEPFPVAKWELKPMTVIANDENLSIKTGPKSSVLKNTSAVRKDTGEYMITIENRHGKDSAVISVVVLGPPGKPGGPIKLSGLCKDSVNLSWLPPVDDGGAGIDSYRVEKYDMKKGVWEKVANVHGNKCTVPKLQENHEYKFRVIAESPNGDSEPLETPDAVLAKKPFDEPHPPGVPTATEQARDHISLTWDPPENDGGSPVIGYDVERKDPKTNRWVPITKVPVEGNEFTDEKVQAEKEYEYRVIAINEAGPSDPSLSSKPIIAKPLKESPKLDLSSLFGAKEIRVRAGEPIDLKLGIDGAPTPTVEWKQNDQPLTPGRVQTTSDEKQAKFHIPRSQRSDTGKYKVKVSNEMGEEEADINIVVLDKPGAPAGPLDVSDITAETCKLKWNPPEDNGGGEITGYIVEKQEEGSNIWEKVPGMVTGTSHNVRGLKDGKHYTFRVKAENIYGTGEPLVGDKMLAKNPFVAVGSPGTPNVDKITKNSVDLTWTKPSNDGGSKITGYVVEKKKKGGDWMDAISVPANNLSATIPNLMEGEEYEFRVKGVNAIGPGDASRPTNLVKAEDQPCKPKLDMSAVRGITVKAGTPFQIKVPFTATPKPRSVWQLEDSEVEDSPRVTNTVSCFFSKNYICLSKSQRSDSGKYKLTLTNPSGSESGYCRVNVLDKPGIPTGPITTADMEGESLTLNWNPPEDDGGEKISNYIVEKRKVGSGRWQKVSSFLTTPTCNVRNLEPGTKYDFRIFAENPHGVSDALETKEAILAKLPYDPPGSPSTPKCVSTTEDSITLNWNPPRNDGGAPIYGYMVEKREKGSENWTKAHTMEIPDNELTVKGLMEGKEYEFRVCAVNAAGSGDYSTTSDMIKAQPPPMQPKISKDLMSGRDIIAKVGQPFKISVPYKGNPIPTVTWTMGGSNIRESDRIVFTNKPDEILFECKAAERGDQGKYNLLLQNEKGLDSCTVNVVVVDAPSKPEGPIDVSKVTPDSCFLSWNPPKDVHSNPVSNYRVEKQDIRTGKWENCSKFVRGTNYEIMGLQEGHQYHFRVCAENEHGVSEPLETVTATTAESPFHKPSAPGVPSPLNVGRTYVALRWDPPRSDGGTKLKGYNVEKKEKGSDKWFRANEFPVIDNEFTVTNLPENAEYEFRVCGVNAVGNGEPSLP
ncbi:hypothetical protein LOTGIDRAFT_91265, partial [Lottia gigantea]